jgi:hypothetical protein
MSTPLVPTSVDELDTLDTLRRQRRQMQVRCAATARCLVKVRTLLDACIRSGDDSLLPSGLAPLTKRVRNRYEQDVYDPWVLAGHHLASRVEMNTAVDVEQEEVETVVDHYVSQGNEQWLQENQTAQQAIQKEEAVFERYMKLAREQHPDELSHVLAPDVAVLYLSRPLLLRFDRLQPTNLSALTFLQVEQLRETKLIDCLRTVNFVQGRCLASLRCLLAEVRTTPQLPTIRGQLDHVQLPDAPESTVPLVAAAYYYSVMLPDDTGVRPPVPDDLPQLTSGSVETFLRRLTAAQARTTAITLRTLFAKPHSVKANIDLPRVKGREMLIWQE